MATYESIRVLNPDVVITAGTCGGFKAKGLEIGDVVLGTHSAFHDRRIQIPGFLEFGVSKEELFIPDGAVGV